MTDLDARTLALVRVAVAVAKTDSEALTEALQAARVVSEDREIEEVLIQSYLFLGYPASLNALAVWRRVSGRTSDPTPSPTDWGGWTERGERVCAIVYGGQYEGLRENIRALHPDMEQWMVTEGYGKVLGRDGLDLPTRELCIVAQLALLDAPRQLYSHARGALNAGASAFEVGAVIEVVAASLPPSSAARARDTWAAVMARRES